MLVGKRAAFRRWPGRHWWLRRAAGGHRVSAARPGSHRSTVLRRAAWHHMRRSQDAGDRPDRHLGQASERATVAERPGPLARLLRARPLSTRAPVAWLAGRAGRCGGRQQFHFSNVIISTTKIFGFCPDSCIIVIVVITTIVLFLTSISR